MKRFTFPKYDHNSICLCKVYLQFKQIVRIELILDFHQIAARMIVHFAIILQSCNCLYKFTACFSDIIALQTFQTGLYW